MRRLGALQREPAISSGAAPPASPHSTERIINHPDRPPTFFGDYPLDARGTGVLKSFTSLWASIFPHSFSLLLHSGENPVIDEGVPSDTLFDFFKELPSVADLKRWEEEHARMGLAIKELQTKRDQLQNLIDVAAALHGGAAGRKHNASRSDTELRSGTWMSAILEITMRNPEGVAYADVRDQMPEPYASKLRKDPNIKSFYGAARKLECAKKVVRYRGHLFTPEGFEIHQARVAAGEIAEVEGYETKAAPIDEEIRKFLAERPRSKASAIKDHVCRFPQFAKGIKRNSSALYNVLRRMKDREEIVHHSDSTYSLANENEAPDGNAVGASETREAATSLFENVVGFPRSR